MMSQSESNIVRGGPEEFLGSATPSALLQYKLRRSHSSDVILDVASLTSIERATLTLAKTYRPECAFVFVRQADCKRPGSPSSRQLYMMSNHSISLVCDKCFLRMDAGHVCTEGRLLTAIEPELTAFMMGYPCDLAMLLEECRKFYAYRPGRNCVYLSILFLADFSVDGYGQLSARAYAKFGRTGRGVKTRYEEHERGIRAFMKTLPDVQLVDDNVRWFPTKDDVGAENSLRESLAKYRLGRTLVGYDKASCEQHSVELIAFPVSISAKLREKMRELPSADAIELASCLDSAAAKHVDSGSNTMLGRSRVGGQDAKDILSGLSARMAALGLETRVGEHLLDICSDEFRNSGIERTFELCALRHADDFREFVYKSIVVANRGRSRYFPALI